MGKSESHKSTQNASLSWSRGSQNSSSTTFIASSSSENSRKFELTCEWADDSLIISTRGLLLPIPIPNKKYEEQDKEPLPQASYHHHRDRHRHHVYVGFPSMLRSFVVREMGGDGDMSMPSSKLAEQEKNHFIPFHAFSLPFYCSLRWRCSAGVCWGAQASRSENDDEKVPNEMKWHGKAWHVEKKMFVLGMKVEVDGRESGFCYD